ncbi:Uncharacterised protein (plasmid) [Tsukamurella tyrosinosolvens]|uniref:Uncharacterized protein n=1 Tax=Tsukamurella tyrosinosolvens TaxID=57704 RepID=A0A1H4UZI8_TSUTY|nr:hypothetical protein [Tsukamurella tyrosinosolvens]KXO91102.1 hypothetical protein AXK58_21980 [Tsukamurella tyrosinosolvens]SEC73828.1 hypothetical protein SAMN04489793_3082 [Tsukamurella tyrosinosolvens]VEH90797.1 Uncharacterised protein [Tsukamurella tyrosinosolvens]
MSETITTRITDVRRANSSRSPHSPVFEVETAAGTFTTKANSQIGFSIENSENRQGDVVLTLERGSIVACRAA